MSNAERQRKFQRAHPGYDRRRKARDRSYSSKGVEQRAAAARAEAAAAVAAAEITLAAQLGRAPTPAEVLRFLIHGSAPSAAAVELPILPIYDLQPVRVAA